MHIPVLSKEVLEYLNPKPGFRFIDCTAGGGGHIKAVLTANPDSNILGIDLDQTTLDKLKKEFADSGLDQKVKLIAGNYADLKKLSKSCGFESADAILLDLGFSSLQIDDAERGFTFQVRGPLDMRFNQSQKTTAAEIINTYPETKLENIIKEYGEESFAKKIAKQFVLKRKISSFAYTDQVVDVIRDALPKPVKHKANDVSRRVFQALRIEVNRELENIRTVLPQALEMLSPKGRLVVISFHSLEDRIVKNFFVEQAKGCICPPDFPTCICNKASAVRILTRKPITSSEQEIAANPRSKPAKLRAAEKI